MSSVCLAWRTDVHNSDYTPVSRTDDWTDAVFHNLEQVHQIARVEGADAIIDGGDFFHIKNPRRNSHKLIRRTAQHHSRYSIPVFANFGNHDGVYGDLDFLPQQPLGVLFSTGVFHKLFNQYEVYFATNEGGHTMVCPFNRKRGEWLGADPFTLEGGGRVVVRVVGIPYHGTSYDMTRFTSLEKGEEDYLVCAAHVLASKKGGTMFEGEDIIKYADLLDTAPDVYLFGHWHKNQGIETMGGKTFVNIGALTRGSLSQDNLDRIPSCAILRFNPDGMVVEEKPLDVPPAEEVFDIEGRKRQVARQIEMDSFVENIRNSLQPPEGEGTLQDAVNAVENVPDAVRERALSYLEKV